MKVGIVGAVLIAVAVGVSKLKPHSEAALLTDWGTPPPWPLFIGLNVLAGVLRGAADALTPPPIKMLDMAMGYHGTMLVHTAQKFKIPDLLAHGPLSAAEIAAKIGSDAAVIKRIMFACAANGVFQLAPDSGSTEPKFVNTALSAVLRVDHPNSMRAMVGHNAEDVYQSWGKLADYVANPKGPIAHDMAWPQYPFAKGGLWAKFEAQSESEDQFGRAMTAIDGLGANAMIADGPGRASLGRIGGGRGHFLHRVLDAHPSLTGVVLDRPPVMRLPPRPGGRPVFSSAAGRALKAGRSSRPRTSPAQTGTWPYMRYILHDWPLKESLSILRNARGDGRHERNAPHRRGASPIMIRWVCPSHASDRHPDDGVRRSSGARRRSGRLCSGRGLELVALHPTRSLVHWVEPGRSDGQVCGACCA